MLLTVTAVVHRFLCSSCVVWWSGGWCLCTEGRQVDAATSMGWH